MSASDDLEVSCKVLPSGDDPYEGQFMILTVEWNPSHQELDVLCDDEGIALLIDRLQNLQKRGGHDHLMTESWAGNELTEQPHKDGGMLVNHVRLVLVDSGGKPVLRE